MAACPGHIPSLDGLRAISVMIVLCSHFVSRAIPGGFGVYIFFVISGFLITRLLLTEYKKSGSISLRRFYARRALRLYPVVITYTLFIVATYVIARQPVNWVEPSSALLYFANYLYSTIVEGQPIVAMPFVPFWSLSVEEHFYFLLPATVLLLRAQPRQLLAAMGVVCVACLSYRLGMAWMHPELLETRFFYYRTECRLDSLAFGVALAAACEITALRYWIQRLANPATLSAGIVLILACLLYREPFFRQTWRYSLLGVGITLALMAVVFRGGWIAALLNTAPFVFVGQISYSLYVWSTGAHTILASLGTLEGKARGLALFAVSFGAACASYFLLEKPLLKLRHRLGSEV
jgi:peptidoglycan/LPS O-acetylase OafA/YrhL